MKSIWTFGDSNTAEYSVDYTWSKKYIEWKGYKPKVYSDFIGEELNLVVKNKGIGAADNHTIFESFCKNVKDIRENDLIIFGWSSSIRFRIPSNNNSWIQLIPSLPNIEDFLKNKTNFSLSSINETFINRNHNLYLIEINWWIHMIEHLVKPRKCLFFTPFTTQTKLNALKFDNIETIVQETKGEINDNHYSENGHKKLAELLINNLNSKII